MTEGHSPAHGEILLRVDRLHKLYARRPATTRARLRGVLMSALVGRSPAAAGKLREHEFWALNDVSFELRRGEALGVIGLNGSGKTTLLRVLAGQILPDGGEVWVNGSSAAMIDLQAGFQPSASGRENIFLRASALGFERAYTKRRLQEIIDFSELGDAIDAPMSTYSSGMKMRLAFSVMSIVQPELLLIDEVLSVGDFQFRQKSLAKMREMRSKSAFVFVSHSMNNIQRFCDRVIVLNRGRIHYMGDPDTAIAEYEKLENQASGIDGPDYLGRQMGPSYANEAAVSDVVHYWADKDGRPVESIAFHDGLRFVVEFTSNVAVRNLIVGVPVWNVNAQYSTGLSTEITSDRYSVAANERIRLTLEADGGMINPGTLKSMLGIMDGVEFLYRMPNPDLLIQSTSHPTWGVVTVPHRWRIERTGAAKQLHDEEAT